MRKFFVITLILFLSQEIYAQVEIGGFGGWLWTGKIPAWRQDIKVSDEGNYGATIGFQIREDMLANFEWNHTDNKATFREYNPDGTLGDFYTVPVTFNYYMLGFNYLVTYSEPLVPYGLLNVGIMTAESGEYSNKSGSSDTYFAAGLGGGLRYYISENIGIKLQARLLLPMQFGGIGFGCGIGTGGANCGAGVSTYTSIIQGDFTGGIILKLGN